MGTSRISGVAVFQECSGSLQNRTSKKLGSVYLWQAAGLAVCWVGG